MPKLSEFSGFYVGSDKRSVTKLMRGQTEVWPSIGTPPSNGGGGEVPIAGSITLSSSYLAAPTFPITVSSNNRGYVDDAGVPFYGVGDTAWNMVSRQSKASFTDYLTQRRAHGFNTLYMSILDINSLTRSQTETGQTPFAATGSSTNITNRNLSNATNNYWTHLQWVVDEAKRLGFLCILIPAWYGYHGNMWRPLVQTASGDTSRAANYGTFLGGLLGDRTNVWWMLGGDNGPGTGVQSDSMQFGTAYDMVAATNAMGNAIKAAISVPQLMTYHSYRGDSASAYFGSQPWYDMHAAYGFADVVADILPEWQRTPVKPVNFVEGYYDARSATGLGTPHLTRLQLRGQAYQGMLAGALSFANGHEIIWGVNYRTGMTFQQGLDAVSADDLLVQSKVFQTFRNKNLVPDHSTPLVTGNRGSGTTLAAGAISSDNRAGLIYFPDSRTATISLSRFTVLPQLAWIHPQTGAVTQFDATGTSMSVTTPSGWSDAILAIEVHSTTDDGDGGGEPGGGGGTTPVVGPLRTLAFYPLTSATPEPTTELTATNVTGTGFGSGPRYGDYTPAYGRNVLQVNPTTTTASTSAGYVEVVLTPDTAGQTIKVESLQIKAARGGSAGPRGLLITVIVDGGTPVTVHSADIPTVRATLTTSDITGLALEGSEIRLRIHPYSPASTSTLEMADLTITGRVNSPGGTLNSDLYQDTYQDGY